MARSCFSASLGRGLLAVALTTATLHCSAGSPAEPGLFETRGVGSGGTAGAGATGGAGGVCALAEDRFRECGIQGVTLRDCDPNDPEEACMATCLVGASCPDLTELASDQPCPALSPGFIDCAVACTAAGSFVCADGTYFVPAAYVCDGYEDCCDSSDEAGCPELPDDFECFDSTDTLPYGWVCDGTIDCLDGSDEAAC